jgi:hypothetical protein
MKRIALLILIIFLAGCSKSGDDKRVEMLQEMPTLWESEIVIADANIGILGTFFTNYTNNFDAKY